MKRVAVHRLDGIDALVLDEAPVPQPASGEVRLRVNAVGLGFVDGLLIAGQYQWKPPLPYVPGGEIAGTIDAVGEGVTGWSAGQRVVAISTGRNHSLAITADGAIWSWGYGRFGKLGHGDEQSQLLPKKVEAFAGQRVVAVSAGGPHSLATTADGAVFTWGHGGHGSLGHGEDLSNQLLPKKVEAWAPGQ